LILSSDAACTDISEVEIEDSACPLGCRGGDEPVLTGEDRITHLPGRHSVVRCRDCGLMRTSPRPTPATMGYYYPPEYAAYSVAPADAAATREGWFVKVAKRLLDVRANRIPPVAPGRMLEIGCASGRYLHAMAKAGWQVEGIELSAAAVAKARAAGLDVEAGALETAERPAGRFDLIVGWMVVEHLHDPAGGLRKLARWTKEGGMLAISVPDAGAATARMFGACWYDLHLPHHLYHYDRQNLTRLLEANGWHVERILSHRTLGNFIGSMGYWLTDRGWGRLGRTLEMFPERSGRLGALALYPLALLLAAFGQTGRMTVWARRKPLEGE
jgi:SAM-dependent methyltransferase